MVNRPATRIGSGDNRTRARMGRDSLLKSRVKQKSEGNKEEGLVMGKERLVSVVHGASGSLELEKDCYVIRYCVQLLRETFLG